jgi:D-xylose transport system substrate-binding protein
MSRARAVTGPGWVSVGLLVALLAACATPTITPAEPSSDTIALLLPESKTARYEGVDRPVFEQVVAERCPGCRVLYANAEQDAARQQQQAESVLTQGVGVLVLDAVDVSAAASIVAAAKARGVPVIAYDRFITDAAPDYYVSFDSRRVGRMQGDALVRAIAEAGGGGGDGGTPDSGVLLVGGAATDPNSAALKAGVLDSLGAAGVTVLAAYDTPDWSPDKAQEWVQGQLTQYAGRVVGVYAANDGTAGGAISAMRAAGLDPVPPVTGQDAELAAIQRIVAGDQQMTVYKAISQQARTAAELAVRVLRGETPMATVQVDGVPSMLLEPIAVTRDEVNTVIVRGGVYTVDQICVQPYTAACRDLGLLDQEDS